MSCPGGHRGASKRRTLKLLAIGCAASALAGCHGPLAVARALRSPESAPAWVGDPRLAERTAAAAATMAHVWGGTPDVLDGWTIRFSDRFIEARGKARVVGKATRAPVFGGGLIEIWSGTSDVCLEATDLAHEVGHVVIRDGRHRDPRWRDDSFWDRMATALRAIVPQEDVPCRERLSSGKGIWH